MTYPWLTRRQKITIGFVKLQAILKKKRKLAQLISKSQHLPQVTGQHTKLSKTCRSQENLSQAWDTSKITIRVNTITDKLNGATPWAARQWAQNSLVAATTIASLAPFRCVLSCFSTILPTQAINWLSRTLKTWSKSMMKLALRTSKVLCSKALIFLKSETIHLAENLLQPNRTSRMTP